MEDPQGSSLAETVTTLQKQLAKKQTFESATASLTHILADHYASGSPSDQKLIYTAVCRAATLLQTRYTAPGFWMAGLKLFEAAAQVLTRSEEKENMQSCISKANENIAEAQREEVPSQLRSGRNPGFLFEGQLTVGPEPPRPAWLVAQNVLEALVSEQERSMTLVESTSDSTGRSDAVSTSQTSQADSPQHTEEGLVQQIHDLMQRVTGLDEFGTGLEEAIEATLQEIGSVTRGTPPASKQVVAKLPVIDVTEDVIKQLGEGVECAVCREHLRIGDKMQEMPCKHLFHPDCLKPWLDEHNSCPICRFELQTDDHDYESKKERDKEFEEERKGAANALPGGEFMYV